MQIQRDRTIVDMLGADASCLEPSALRGSDVCVALLSPSGRILTASRALVQVMGLDDQTQLLGRHWCKIWPSWAHDALAEAVGRALAGQISTYWAQYPNPAGAMVDWDVRVSPVFDEADAVSSVLAVSRPVTKH